MHQKQLINRCWMVQPVLRIRIGFNADPDPLILVTADLDPYPYPDTRFWWPKLEKILLQKNCNFLSPRHRRPSYRRSLHSAKENIQHFKTCNFFTFVGQFLQFWIRIQPIKWLRIRIPIHNTGYNGCQAAWFKETLTVSHMLIQYGSPASGTVL